MKRIGEIPQLGYGTWQRAGDACYRGVRDALEVGYRHIDTAEGYENEAEVGRALADVALPRDEVWVTTKVAPESFGPGQLRPHVEASLDKLGLDQVDLLLLHYPSINDEYEIEDYMAQFAEVYDDGLARHIGVSNFTKHYLDRALELLGDRKILTNQVEVHVLMQNRPIVEHCRNHYIPVTAYSPLARGAVKDDPLLGDMAAEKGITPAQLAIAFLLAENHVVIPSAGSRERIAENFAAQEVELAPREIAELRRYDQGKRLVNGPWCPVWDV
jgi:2,5-diketo-D-gluconate reductase B